MSRSLALGLIVPCCLLAPRVTAQGGTDWTQVFPTTSPQRLVGAPLAYDSDRHVTVLFGGTGGGAHDDTWEYDGKTWVQRMPANKPPPRAFMAMAYDSARHVCVMFGGRNGSVSMNDTWEWDGTDWTQRMPQTSPPAQSGEAMAYDAARQRVVMFSGISLGDTWEWDGTNWMLASSDPNLARDRTALAYDERRQRTVMFGGTPTPGLADTWEWDGATWTQRMPATSPPGRSEHAMAYDSARGRVVLFGGISNFNQVNDTWEWDGANWMQRTTMNAPSARDGFGMAYDAERGVVVLFGQGTGDTWEYSPNVPGSWRQFGVGCAGTAGTPELRLASAPPYAGDRFLLALDHAGSSPSVLTVGLSATNWLGLPLPFDLTGLGLPGCSLLASADLVVPLGSGVAPSVEIPVPAFAGAIGLAFYDQAIVYDAAANAGGAVVSNGGAGIIGGK